MEGSGGCVCQGVSNPRGKRIDAEVRFHDTKTRISVKKHRFIFILKPHSATTALQCFSRKCVFRNNCQEIIIMKFISILTVFPMLSALTMMRSGAAHLHVVSSACFSCRDSTEIQMSNCAARVFYHAHISASPAFESFTKAKGIYFYLFFYHTNSDIELERGEWEPCHHKF